MTKTAIDPRARFHLSRTVKCMGGVGLFLSVVTSLAHVGLMAVSGWFITAMTLAGIAGVSINYFSPAALIRAMAIIRTAGRYAERLATHDAALRFIATFRPWLFRRIEALPAHVQEQLHSARLFDLLRADLDRIEKFYISAFLPVVTAGVVLACGVGVALWLHIPMGVALGSFVIIAAVVVPWVVLRLSRDYNATVVADAEHLRADMVDMADGMAELVIFGRTHDASARMISRQSGMIAAQEKLAIYDALAAQVQGAGVFFAGLCSLCIVVATGGLTAPETVAMTLGILALADTIMPLPAAMQLWDVVRYARARITALVISGVPEPAAMLMSQPYILSFDNVSFDYGAAGGFALSGVSFTLGQGQSLVIAGATGSGKSTVAAIAAGVRTAGAGTVMGAGIDTVSLAEQKPYIFAGTVRRNLLLANPKVDDNAVACVLRASGLDAVLKKFPDGLDTRLGTGGVQLSGGERRRLSIARALLKNAPCLVLDEPDEGLDMSAVTELMKNLSTLCHDRKQALLVISHNRHVIESIDRTLFLDGGRPVSEMPLSKMLDFGK